MVWRAFTSVLFILSHYSIKAHNLESNAYVPPIHHDEQQPGTTHKLVTPTTKDDFSAQSSQLDHKLTNHAREIAWNTFGKERSISITNGGTINGELLVTLPMTFFLPTLISQERKQENGVNFDDAFQFQLKNDSAHQHQVIKGGSIEKVFHLLNIREEECKLHFICQVMKSPDDFVPLSNIIYLFIRRANSTKHKYQSEKLANQQDLYSEAFKIAKSQSDCKTKYPGCHTDATSFLDINMLHFWQKLSEGLSVKIVDS